MSLYNMHPKVIKLALHFMSFSSPRSFPGFYCHLPFNLRQTWGYYRQHWKCPQQLPYKHHGVRSSGLRLWGHSYASFLSPTTDGQSTRPWALKWERELLPYLLPSIFPWTLGHSSSSLYLLPASILISFLKVEFPRLPINTVLLWTLTNSFLFCTV